MGRMKLLALRWTTVWVCLFGLTLSGQTLAPSPGAKNDSSLLQELARKIDEQNAKIDTLSQHILKLEQQFANGKPGVMIGESTPAPTTNPFASTPAATAAPAATASSPAGNTHIVARGETLTSIAKMHKVTVDELQKLNHIENPLKLQAGQSIMIPSPGSSPAATTSASPSPSN